jgi:hypothetical protein
MVFSNISDGVLIFFLFYKMLITLSCSQKYLLEHY